MRYRSRRRRLPTHLSRPWRLWWSFGCSRRCSVKSAIRRVSSAICTGVEPWSAGCFWYFAMSAWRSCLVMTMRLCDCLTVRHRRQPGFPF